MKRCPITYLPCGETDYASEGGALLLQNNCILKSFPYTQAQQLELALEYADKLSIQGLQPKLSVAFDEESSTFKPVQRNGTYILKLPHRTFSEMPQNEDLTMRLAKMAGIIVPIHGMIYSVDRTLLYFIQRFDRQKQTAVRNLGIMAQAKGKRGVIHKISVEDFTQLASLSRDTKYDFSMEQLIPLIEQYCTFPMSEKEKLFRLVIVSFLIGNEDLHLKNFSLIRKDDLTELSPAYDLLNSTIILNSKEELALPLRGKKSNLKREDLVSYYGHEKLGLPLALLSKVLEEIKAQISPWKELIGISFLSEENKLAYLKLLESRIDRLFG